MSGFPVEKVLETICQSLWNFLFCFCKRQSPVDSSPKQVELLEWHSIAGGYKEMGAGILERDEFSHCELKFRSSEDHRNGKLAFRSFKQGHV